MANSLHWKQFHYKEDAVEFYRSLLKEAARLTGNVGWGINSPENKDRLWEVTWYGLAKDLCEDCRFGRTHLRGEQVHESSC